LKGVLGIPDVFPQVSGQPRKWIDRWIDGETIQEQPSSPQPSASSQQPIASGQQPAASNPQPTANSKTLEAFPAAFVLRQRRNSPEYPHESPSALGLAGCEIRAPELGQHGPACETEITHAKHSYAIYLCFHVLICNLPANFT
jgi:hypothetical protein